MRVCVCTYIQSKVDTYRIVSKTIDEFDIESRFYSSSKRVEISKNIYMCM